MRAGSFLLSLGVHLGLALAGVIVIPQLSRAEPTPMVILPVELLTIDETTNVAPVAEKPKPDEKTQDETAPAETASAGAKPEPEPEVMPAPAPPPKKPEPKVEPPKDTQAKQEKKKDFNSELDSILKTVSPKKSKAAPADTKSATNLRNVEDAAEARRGVGDRQKMTITVADFIRQQLLSKGCWDDHDDAADASRLRAVIRVRFGRDGRFSEEPQLISPARIPSGDPPMQVYVQQAFRALAECNTKGFQVPPQYYEHQPLQWIDITFLP
jgi:outer membrane biosynthesis protein TonB